MHGTIDLVCFDLGGVVVRICRSWAEGCAAAGLPVRGTTTSEEAKQRRRSLSALLQRGLMTPEQYFAAIAGATDGPYTAEEVSRVHHAWLLGEYPGVGEVVEALRHAGTRTGILSNTDASHWDRMTGDARKFPTIARLGHRHASHLLGCLKPEPEIFLAFEKRVETPGSRILFFDDTPENVESARRAGWNAELIDHASDPAEQMRRQLARAGLAR